VEGIRMRRFRKIKRSKRIMKSMKIKIQPLCGEYVSWVLYLSFKEEYCGLFFCIVLVWRWLGQFFWGRSVYVPLKIEVENMEIS